MTNSSNSNSIVDVPEQYPIRSPYRPLTRSAEHALRHEIDATVIGELEDHEEGGVNGLVLDERPPHDLLEEHELEIDLPPHQARADEIDSDAESVWQTDDGELVVIYPDRTTIGDREYEIPAEEATERAETEFNRLA
jgi:hypothetical protein